MSSARIERSIFILPFSSSLQMFPTFWGDQPVQCLYNVNYRYSCFTSRGISTCLRYSRIGYTIICMCFSLIGLFVLGQAKVMPDADFKNFTIGVTSSVAGGGFVFFMVFAWRMDKTSERLKKIEEEQTQQRQPIEGFKSEIHTLNTTNSVLLQQLVDKANHPTTNTLPTPANFTGKPKDITKLASSNQVLVASNGHVSNGS